MTDLPMPSDIEQLPQIWRNLWRAHTSLPASVASDELTIFVRAGDTDVAHLAIKRALHSMFPAAHQELDEAYYNLSSASELVREGLSERHVDRLFEVGWSGGTVEAWVGAPVFVVPEAAALYAAWITAQLDHASLAFVHAPGIDVDGVVPLSAQRNTKDTAKTDNAPTVTAIRDHDGFLIAGDRLVIKVHPSGGRDQIDVDVSATAEAIGGDRGVRLGVDARLSFEPQDIRIDGDVLACAAQTSFMARYAPGVTDYREGFTVTLEPGQADAVRQAVAQLRRVLTAYQAVADLLRPRLSGEPDPWNVQIPVFHLVVARVLDGADRVAALAALDKGAHSMPTDARSCVEDPALWAALDRAAGLPSA